MFWAIFIFWIILLTIIIKINLDKNNRTPNSNSNEQCPNKSWAYHAKLFFFSCNEKDFYWTLKKVVYDSYIFKYEIYPKVRLADIFETNHWKTWLKKIRMRHVDFLIVDKEQAFKPVLAIELNGPSHRDYWQHKSDIFKQSVFDEAKLPLIKFNNSISHDYNIIKNNLIQYLWTPIENKLWDDKINTAQK